ncbi:MAG TPA: BTAD domain-containing putative transcriptional regulator [Candidatus Limnocylindrales bacterium]|nr:BTAD domain-containing putative transcriptional regulator [Candidatus Limnocylindrales bacterium]
MKISLLGPVEVRSDEGTLVDLGGARLRTLLIRLAVDPDQVVGHDALVDAVWGTAEGGEQPANAANALQQLVSRLRRAGIPIDSSPSGYVLRVPRKDIDLFNGDAAGPWRGPALAEAADQPWAVAPIARATEQRLAAQEISTDDVSELEALVAANPLRERPVAQLMHALAREGRPAEALRVFERHRRLLADELGADPSRELTELNVSLLRGESVAPLPLALTSFVGRDHETGQLRGLLTRTRLATLTGPGGSGKTRLAVETARPLPNVWLVELAPHGEATEVAPAIIAALGVREQALLKQARASEPAEKIVAALSHQTGLIILDNCEHLIAAAAGMAQHILSTCPGIRILATSREPLGIGGESIYPVEPLPLEHSLRLLHERAAASAPLVPINPDAAQRLCAALDGMPLAIELAAARLRSMPLEQLVSRLDERFRLLTGGDRTALPRHQTLRAVVDWSWELCTPAEREVWQRFSAFHGGASIEAVEAVCGEFEHLSALVDKSLVRVEGGRYRMLETIREYGLDRLGAGRAAIERQHALYFLGLAEEAEPYLRGPQQVSYLKRLRADHDNLHAALRRAVAWSDAPLALRFVAAMGWYWWLSGARAEGARLSASALDLPVSERAVDPEKHAMAYTLAALNQMDSHSEFTKSGEWFARAAEIAEPIADKHPVLRLVAPMRHIAPWSNEKTELILPLYRELFTDPDPWVASTARAFHAHALINHGKARRQAISDFQNALRGYREAGDRWGMSLVLEALSTLEASDGDYAAAAASAQEAIDLLTEMGTIEDLLQLRMRLVAAQWLLGDEAACVATLDAARVEADRLGLPVGLAMVTLGFASLARAHGDLPTAKVRFAEAAALVAEGAVPPQFLAILAGCRGLIAGEEGDLVAAREYHTAALRHALDSSDFPVVGAILVGCADLALREGDGELAAKLLGAATSMNGGVDRSLPDRPRIEESVIKAIGPQRFAVAYAMGESMTLASATALTGLPLPAA